MTLRYSRLTVLFGILLVLAVAGGVGYAANARGSTEYLPTLTMTYEASVGPNYGGGATREVHLFEFTTKNDWKDTVIEAESFTTAPGDVVSSVGSYKSVNGTTYEQYDSTTDRYNRRDTEGSILVPNQFLVPWHIGEMKKEHDGDIPRKSTGAKVCYLEECEEDAAGLVFMIHGAEWLFADESRWGIPLRVGDEFVVRELRIEADRE